MVKTDCRPGGTNHDSFGQFLKTNIIATNPLPDSKNDPDYVDWLHRFDSLNCPGFITASIPDQKTGDYLRATQRIQLLQALQAYVLAEDAMLESQQALEVAQQATAI